MTKNCICVCVHLCVLDNPLLKVKEREMNRLSFALFRKSICRTTLVDSSVPPRPCRTIALFNGLGANFRKHQPLFFTTRWPGLHFRCCMGTLKRRKQNLKLCVCIYIYNCIWVIHKSVAVSSKQMRLFGKLNTLINN